MGLYSVDPDGSDNYRWTHPGDSIVFSCPTCSSDSDTLFGLTYRRSDMCLAAYYPGDTAVTSIFECGYTYLRSVKPSPDTRYIAFNSTSEKDRSKSALYLFDRSDGSIRLLDTVRTESFDFSPDGLHIVYSDLWTTGGLRVVNLRTGKHLQLTSPREDS